MLILSLDSSGPGCSACVWRDGVVLALSEERMERGQDQRLMPLVLGVMAKAHLEFAAIDRIAVTRGPGSFTGLRIGLAAARGIGLAAGKPVIGIDRFAIYRSRIKEQDKNVLIVLESKRQELYCKFYPAFEPAHDAQMLTREAIAVIATENADTILSGDVKIENFNFRPFIESESIPCAVLASRGEAGNPGYLPRPLYLRPPDVTMAPGPATEQSV